MAPPAAVSVEAAAALHQAGRYAEAEAAYRTLIEAGDAAARPMVRQLLALLHRQAGEPAKALCVYDEALALGEGSAEMLSARGDVLHGLGRYDEALDSYDQALALEPDRPEALNNRGATLEALGQPDAALAAFEAALRLRPDYAQALANRGAALLAGKRFGAALDSLDRALALQPAAPRALGNRGLALMALRRVPEALACFDQALALTPGAPELLNNRSAALRGLGRPHEALAAAEAALAARPNFADALNSGGLALAALDRWPEALASYDRALAGTPGHLEALNNAGSALIALERFDEGLARFEAALARDPGFAEAEFNSALALLRLGRFAPGWRRHEARWRRAGHPGPRHPDATLWLGQDSVAGRRVLLHAEQGLGDTLQFCRYAPWVAARGARVTLQVQPALKPLLAGLAGVERVVAAGEPVAGFDRHAPLMSLPLALGLDGPTDPAPSPYLQADPARLALWSVRLPRSARARIGLVWSGNAAHENDRNRSIPLAALAPLLTTPRLTTAVEIVSLQKEVRAYDQPALAGLTAVRSVNGLEDFADTAAVIAACDLVISVDTSVAHLAGALGRPVWILLPRHSDWRWGAPDDRAAFETTRWYPSARLYRQRTAGDWAEVIGRLAADLSADVLSTRPPD